MTSIITGDIINSRAAQDPATWMKPLKKLLSGYGKSPKAWEIYRGDSFQLEVPHPEDALLAAIRIKACIRAVRALDVRLAIGVGEKSHDAARITEANGTAFIHSGETFETLKKARRTLAVRTPWPEADRHLNLALLLASALMDHWTPSSAEIMLLSLQDTELSQKKLGEQLGRTQSSVSERQSRAFYAEVLSAIRHFRETILQYQTS